ncbi:MAG TPA: PIN domain-containing protein [Methylomirabilota bacterium]|nr:PIN domain-containing protein [Methylomirabilota bacterium]
MLDTNIVSETSKPQPNDNVVKWLQAHRNDCALSAITIAEMRHGIERLPEGKRKTTLEKQFDFLVEDYAEHFYEFDGAAAYEWGRYVAELEAEYGADWWKRFDLRDTQIAAIAREYGLIVATRNVDHFPFCQTKNPFV